ncbi:uncharacterized protein [Euwallacea similis]|uniref:uncharacterized protein n=1 Tax=Euwallacea similis TaxID=1736056 RepID=UPI00344BCBED
MCGLKCILILYFLSVAAVSGQSGFNPSIIQDSRLEPKVDGTFGFQYRTEDGISHAAQGDPSGFIQGAYSYKDPTGLKVNFNYFAGARNGPAAAQEQPPLYRVPQYDAPPQSPNKNQPPVYRPPEPYQPPQEYRPRTRPPASYTRPQYDAAGYNEVH